MKSVHAVLTEDGIKIKYPGQMPGWLVQKGNSQLRRWISFFL